MAFQNSSLEYAWQTYSPIFILSRSMSHCYRSNPTTAEELYSLKKKKKAIGQRMSFATSLNRR